MQTLRSVLDSSINIVQDIDIGEKIESRYVHRKHSDHAIIYISSQTGCDQLCKFCHLTQSGQTVYRDCTIEEIFNQVDLVWEHIDFDRINTIHFNFMARGEPLNNNNILENLDSLFFGFRTRCERMGKEFKVLFSSIIPKKNADRIFGFLDKALRYKEFYLYYSLYGDEEFRKRWMVNAYDLGLVLSYLGTKYQDGYTEQIVLHWAFIDGYNTNGIKLQMLAKRVLLRGLDGVRVNIVRFNSFNELYREPSEERISELLGLWNKINPNERNKIVPRVGYDVNASCGMFMR